MVVDREGLLGVLRVQRNRAEGWHALAHVDQLIPQITLKHANLSIGIAVEHLHIRRAAHQVTVIGRGQRVALRNAHGGAPLAVGGQDQIFGLVQHRDEAVQLVRVVVPVHLEVQVAVVYVGERPQPVDRVGQRIIPGSLQRQPGGVHGNRPVPFDDLQAHFVSGTGADLRGLVQMDLPALAPPVLTCREGGGQLPAGNGHGQFRQPVQADTQRLFFIRVFPVNQMSKGNGVDLTGDARREHVGLVIDVRLDDAHPVRQPLGDFAFRLQVSGFPAASEDQRFVRFRQQHFDLHHLPGFHRQWIREDHAGCAASWAAHEVAVQHGCADRRQVALRRGPVQQAHGELQPFNVFHPAEVGQLVPGQLDDIVKANFGQQTALPGGEGVHSRPPAVQDGVVVHPDRLRNHIIAGVDLQRNRAGHILVNPVGGLHTGVQLRIHAREGVAVAQRRQQREAPQQPAGYAHPGETAPFRDPLTSPIPQLHQRPGCENRQRHIHRDLVAHGAGEPDRLPDEEHRRPRPEHDM